MTDKVNKIAVLVVMLLAVQACSMPQEQAFRERSAQASLAAESIVAADGEKLPLKRWVPQEKPKAVILALHGFNDYSQAFEIPGEYFSRRGVAVFAYDQRGFGAHEQPGIWGGQENLVHDVRDMVTALKAAYPDVPLFVLGESMGAAVAINACHFNLCPQVDGLILIAPAVWGDETMNFLYRGMLWAMAHLIPDSRFTGEDVAVQATDNIELLRAMGRDPLVIKKTRVDAIYGIVNLMDDAYLNIEKLSLPVLLLYGAKDEVIPVQPVRLAIEKLNAPHTVAYYPEGYHMLMRDLKGEVVMNDIATWVQNRYVPLPSGHDMGWHEAVMYGE